MRWIRRHTGVILGIFVALVLMLPAAARFYGDFLWFQSLDFASVFLRILSYKIGLFLGATLVSAAVLYGSYRWTIRNIRQAGSYTPPSWVKYVLLTAAVFLGFAVIGEWESVLKYLHATPFNITDPVFNQDAAFYTFTLPLFKSIVFYGLLLVTAAGFAAFSKYAAQFGVEQAMDNLKTVEQPRMQTASFNWNRFTQRIHQYANIHAATILTLFFTLLAAYFYLARYDLLMSEVGAVTGVGFTDATVRIPVLTGLTLLSLVAAATSLLNAVTRKETWVAAATAAVALVFLLGMGAAALTQTYVVEPDELSKEKPHLEKEIKFTRAAYDLTSIQAEEYPVSPRVSQQELANNTGTLRNARIWDWRPLLKTYNEVQVFRSYYTFPDIDVDRYQVNGEKTAVMLGTREIDVNGLPPNSRSWVNKHLVYTHGFGIAMSPVRNMTSEGLPRFYMQDLPPRTRNVDVNVSQPRVYYGEETSTYAVVNTDTQELDYPRGENNVYTSYRGDGGVAIANGFRRLIYATQFSAAQIFFSDAINQESRIMFNRNIKERVKRIAPFLQFDDDPYMVATDNGLHWIIDGYTTAEQYPYAAATRFKGEETRYIRNSVKTVVNAYTGEVTFYVAEDEPVINTYQSMFPDMFTPLEEMPDQLQQHIRYPEDLFTEQMQKYRLYHMQDPQVFYNREDVWRIPREITRGNEEMMEPYYIVMEMPGENTTEFVQILPFIPDGKENMIGWVAARSDPAHYGNMTAYHLTKQELVFGPMQIESRIDQDTQVSQRITLWSRSGSDVFRGNLLALPIADSMLYVEPLYLQSQESGSLPQVKRVIAAQGNRLAMKPTFTQALNALYNETEREQGFRAPQQGQGETVETLQDARQLYREAQVALRNGNFTLYSQKITELGTLLNE